jgi:hypothetical protein
MVIAVGVWYKTVEYVEIDLAMDSAVDRVKSFGCKAKTSWEWGLKSENIMTLISGGRLRRVALGAGLVAGSDLDLVVDSGMSAGRMRMVFLGASSVAGSDSVAVEDSGEYVREDIS